VRTHTHVYRLLRIRRDGKKDHADRMDEDMWSNIAWNYKRAGRRVKSKTKEGLVQVLR